MSFDLLRSPELNRYFVWAVLIIFANKPHTTYSEHPSIIFLLKNGRFDRVFSYCQIDLELCNLFYTVFAQMGSTA